MSVLLRPAVQARTATGHLGGRRAAVCEAVEEAAGVSTRVKWVNDILVDGRKVAGILTEAVGDLESGTMESVVVGIGVNVKTPADAFPEELRERAGSLLPPGCPAATWPPASPTACWPTPRPCPSAGIWSPTGSGWPCWASRYNISSVSGGWTGRAVDLREDGCLMVEGPGGMGRLRAEKFVGGEWQ